MNKLLNNVRGITLIALVITVIVLLILAAVTINALSGDNGILKRAIEAKQKTQSVETLEKIQMAIIKATAKGIGNVDKSNLRFELEQVGVTVKSEGDDLPWEVVSGNYMLRINDDLSIDEIGETVSVTAADIAANKEKYYGQVAQNYTAGGLTYRIFYVDTENKFGDGANTVYLKADYKTRTTLIDYTSYNPEGNDLEVYKRMNPLWSAQRESIEQVNWNHNEREAGWLCSPSQWETYLDDTKAKYAIGAPSVEMYVASYNDVPHAEVGNYTLGATYRATSTPGYIYTLNGAQSTISGDDYYIGKDSLDYKGYGSMYAGKDGIKGEDYYWWLASPSSNHYNCVCIVNGSYATLSNTDYNYEAGVCPIVSLKSGIPVQVEK